MKLDKLKTKLKFISKGVRHILVNVKVNNDSIECNDLETFVKIKNNYGMSPGLQRFDTLGLIESNSKDVDDYPLVDFDDEFTDRQIETTMEILQDLNKYASNDETRPFLSGVAVDRTHLVATNGHVCKYVELDNEIENSYIIPRTGIINLVKLLKGFKIKGSFKIELNEEYAVIDNEYFTCKIRLIAREYIKWQAIVPDKFEYSFTVTNWINLKELKGLFCVHRYACTLKTIKGNVVLIPKGYDGLAHYIIGKTTHNFELGFNVNYLDLAAKKDKQFTIKFNNDLSPCMVNGAIVMPLKL